MKYPNLLSLSKSTAILSVLLLHSSGRLSSMLIKSSLLVMEPSFAETKATIYAGSGFALFSLSISFTIEEEL
ncbi:MULTISPECIES: hypothetical protein [Acidiplasma]|jgi:hypothetical protein|uniref:hypothetical protein n=1 Tax=Acidiplasma TaxID=507753 RepID=UPI000AA76582|nr:MULTISPECIES: hypothetical protein [Acidiplasma]WMT54892.1 MAG: hypothetical protein RE470_08255 [Acidiplasma sp.]